MPVEETLRQPLASGRGMDGSTEIHNLSVPRPASMATIEQDSLGKWCRNPFDNQTILADALSTAPGFTVGKQQVGRIA